MSAVAPTQDVFAADEDIVTGLEQGGSPAEPNSQAGASGGTEPVAEGEQPEAGAAEGVEPEAKDGAGKTPDAWLEEKRELEAQIAQARQLFDDIQAVASRDPAVAKALGFRQDNGSVAPEWKTKVLSSLDGLTPESRTVMENALNPILDQIETALRDLNSVKPTVGRLAQNTAQTQFRQGLVDAKVPVDNPAFQKVLKDLRRDPEFASLEARGSALAVRAAANEWFAKTGRAAANGDARVQLAAAKSGRIGARPAGGAALAEKIVKFQDGFDPHRHFQILDEARKAGRPAPKIVYEK